MKMIATTLFALAVGSAGPALAQSQHQTHGGTAPQASGPSTTGNSAAMPMMMGSMPEQCQAAMQAMPSECVAAMREMMQTGMGQGVHGGMMQHGDADSDAGSPADESASAARQAYQDAMDRMHGPMAEAGLEEDPDVAFVKGMIPHHQGAIDMARIVQQYGDDEETKSWAARIIEAQEGEIREMEEWLRQRGE